MSGVGPGPYGLWGAGGSVGGSRSVYVNLSVSCLSGPMRAVEGSRQCRRVFFCKLRCLMSVRANAGCGGQSLSLHNIPQ